MVARITTSQEYFDTLQDRFIADASKGVDVQISYDLSGDGGGLWTITVKDQTLSIAEGGCEKLSFIWTDTVNFCPRLFDHLHERLSHCDLPCWLFGAR